MSANKLTSADHKNAIAQLMSLVIPFISDRGLKEVNNHLAIIIAESINPARWKRESKRKGENGEIIRRFHDRNQDITVDTFETELSPGKWSVGVEMVEANAWVILGYREFIKSLNGDPITDMDRETLAIKPVYPASMSDADNKPEGFGAFA